MRYGCDPVSHELMDLWRQSDDETVFALTGQSRSWTRLPRRDERRPVSAVSPRTCGPRAARPALSRLRSAATERSSCNSASFSPSSRSSSWASCPTRRCLPRSCSSTRGRPLIVWLGAAAAFTVHVVIAVTIGVALFHLLPHRALEAIVAAIFFVGGLLALREARKASRRRGVGRARGGLAPTRGRFTAFLVIFMAEWGDLTQILTANLAAHYHDPLSVGVGARAGALGRGGARRPRRPERAAVRSTSPPSDRHRGRAVRADRVGHLGGGALTRRGSAPSGGRCSGVVPAAGVSAVALQALAQQFSVPPPPSSA